MSESKENVPRGVRPGYPRRPKMDDDAWQRIYRKQEHMKDRESVRFCAFKIDPAWRRLPAEEREAHKKEFEEVIERWGRKMMVYSYGLVGTRGDADFMLWQASREQDDLHDLAADLNRTALAGWLTMPHSYFAMTRRSIYLNRYEEEYIEKYGGEKELDHARVAINPQGSKYLFIYPFVKTRAWYMLTQEERQRMMDEHIRKGHEWPDVKLNTTYSYGLDDQEFVVAFEGDYPGRFVDLLMALRLTEASLYTERDVPALTGRAMSMRDTLDSIG